MILQFCGLSTDHLPCIAEVNEEKVGRYTPGTNIPIVSESTAHQMKPNYFLVLPWHFKNNLLKREDGLPEKWRENDLPAPRDRSYLKGTGSSLMNYSVCGYPEFEKFFCV